VVLTETFPRVWHVCTVDPWELTVQEMLFNWRLVLSPAHVPRASPEGSWCYFGADWQSLCTTVAAATQFDPATHTAPVGFDREVLPWTPPEDPHTQMVAELGGLPATRPQVLINPLARAGRILALQPPALDGTPTDTPADPVLVVADQHTRDLVVATLDHLYPTD
jgi:hypothetical protein